MDEHSKDAPRRRGSGAGSLQDLLKRVLLVRAAGIEPARLTAADFKSDASTNFAMPAPPGLYYGMPLGC
jgi:hypothetical protein